MVKIATFAKPETVRAKFCIPIDLRSAFAERVRFHDAPVEAFLFGENTTSANNAELVGQLDHAITDHEYPPTVWSANSGLWAMCIFRLLRASNLCEDQTKAVFDPKLMVGGVQRKVVLDESGFRA